MPPVWKSDKTAGWSQKSISRGAVAKKRKTDTTQTGRKRWTRKSSQPADSRIRSAPEIFHLCPPRRFSPDRTQFPSTYTELSKPRETASRAAKAVVFVLRQRPAFRRPKEVPTARRPKAAGRWRLQVFRFSFS